MVTVKVKKEYFTLILIILFTVLLFRFPDEIKNGINHQELIKALIIMKERIKMLNY